MRRPIASFVLAALVVLAATGRARAGYFDRVEIGARGLALASAYGASVDDVSALHWNPAGLSLLDRPELLLTHSRPYLVGDLSTSAVTAGTRLGPGGIAASWHRLGATDIVSENLLSVAYGRWVYKDDRRTVHAGAAAKLALVSYSDRASDLRDFGSESGFTADLGVQVQEGDRFRFGAVVRNLGEPDFDFVEGGESTPMESGLELSASYRWRPESTLHFSRGTIDGEAAWNYAGEIWFYEVFAIRAGVFDEDFSGGFGIRGDRWEVDGGFVTHKFLGNTYRVSVLLHLANQGGRP